MFYPKAIWGKYAEHLKDLDLSVNPENVQNSLSCINEMVTNAMEHAEDCIDFLRLLKDYKIFRFCAIPQVMAIATLKEIYNNPVVFKGEVKIRKTMAVDMAVNTQSIKEVYRCFSYFAKEMKAAIPHTDPNAQKLTEILDSLLKKIADLS